MGHLINPIQFRLCHSAFTDRNWPALNKEQYMFCYGIQKDFTDYFKSLFLFKKKLILKRKHKKRRFFTKNKTPRLVFSHCNVNFFGFNLNRVLVDVNIFDLRFESKWSSLFDNRRFQKFLFKFSQVFRTAKILRMPNFFINIKKETVKQFFSILNKQYHKVNGTLLSQTSKWVKAYLSKIYQKFFSFFTDSAYLVNKRKTLRRAKRYIKKQTAEDHLNIVSKYELIQKKTFLKNWSKIFLLLSPLTSKIPSKIFNVKNQKKISKIKKMLIVKNKYLFNFSDIFDIYFKVIAHKFAKKVRRRELNRFYSLVEERKKYNYLKSIKTDFNYSLRRLSLNKPILSLIPIEDKIRLFKSQAHYYLKNIVLKKHLFTVNRYIYLMPALDLNEELMPLFSEFKKTLAVIEKKINTQSITKRVYTRATSISGLHQFVGNVRMLLFLLKYHNIHVKSLVESFRPKDLLYPMIFFKENNDNKFYTNIFKAFINEFTKHKNKKQLVNKELRKFIVKNAYISRHKFVKRKIKEKPFFKFRNKFQTNKNKFQNNKFQNKFQNNKFQNKFQNNKFQNKFQNNKFQNKFQTNKFQNKFQTNKLQNNRNNKFKNNKFQTKFQNNKFQNKFQTNKNNKFRNNQPKIRIFKEYPVKKFILLSKLKLKSSNYKNILRNWAIYEGNFWVERLIHHLEIFCRYMNRAQVNYSKFMLYKTTKRDRKSLIPTLQTIKYPFIKRRYAISAQNECDQNYFQNYLYPLNNLTNYNFSTAQKELIHSLDYSDQREKFLKATVIPEPKKRKYQKNKKPLVQLPAFEPRMYKNFESPSVLSNIDPYFSERRPRVSYHYTLDPFFQKYMKLKRLKSLLVNIAVDIGDKKMITAKFLSHWLKSLFKKGRKIGYVLRTLDRFVRPSNNYIGAVSVLFVGRYTRSAYTTNKYYRYGRLNNGEILKHMDYDAIEFTTKFGMCGIKVKIQYKQNIFANRNLVNYLKSSYSGSEAATYKFNNNLHLPMLIKYGSKRLFRIHSNLNYKNNIPFYQFK